MAVKQHKTNELRRTRHCVFALNARVDFVTKYRRKVLTAAALDVLKEVFDDVGASLDAQICAFEGERDHIHVLMSYPPKLPLAILVKALKGASSRRLRQACPDVAKRYWRGVLWTPSYFATSCRGAPLELIRTYIEQQDRPL